MTAPRPLTHCGCASGSHGSGPDAGEACSRCGGNEWFGPDGKLWFASAEGRAAMHAKTRSQEGRPTCGATPSGLCGSCQQFMPDEPPDSVAGHDYSGAASFSEQAESELIDAAVLWALMSRHMTNDIANFKVAAWTLLDALHVEALAWDAVLREIGTK
jgi:hypothetical protein